jgi:phenylacetate-coenzyme A ligase PaaK-like adenylate-forming protein
MPAYAYAIPVKEEKQIIKYSEEHELNNDVLSFELLRKYVNEGETFAIVDTTLTVYKQRYETDDEQQQRVSREKAYMKEYNRRKNKHN